MAVISRFFFIIAVSFYYIIDSTLREIRPRYLETVEESLNDTAHILTEIVEKDLIFGPSGQLLLRTEKLATVMESAKKRNFEAKIYGYTKTKTTLDVYVTDQNGIVVYDSQGIRQGKDYSRYNDVFLTLRGKYGARSSRIIKEDPASGALFVAAPILLNNQIVGVLTVIKPKDSVTVFIDLARNKFINAGIVVAVSVILLGMIVFFSITRPIERLRKHVLNSSGKFNSRIPEIKDLASAFETMKKEIEGRKYVEDYVANLTHELKTPLAALRASAELLENHSADERRLKLYKNIEIESKRMQSIIDAMLSLASVENKRKLQVEKVDIRVLIDRAIEAAEFSIPEDQNTAILFHRPVNPEPVECDPFLVEQTILNLLQNAVSFANENTPVNLSLIRNGSFIDIEIRNEGPRIPDYALEKLFDRFYSLPRPKTGRKSTGLGLPFALEVARLHSGRLSIQNMNNGVLSKLTLPVYAI